MNATEGVPLYYNVHRWYEYQTGRYTRKDPDFFQNPGDQPLYAYALQNPLGFTDPLGLRVLVCSRRAFRNQIAGGVSNHGYLWWDNRPPAEGPPFCGIGRAPFEMGPSLDNCVIVPGSDGRERDVFDCCESIKERWRWFPLWHDCQKGVEKALECADLPNPGVPGGRVGGPCEGCLSPQIQGIIDHMDEAVSFLTRKFRTSKTPE